MDDHEILQHLLNVEAEAAALVDDAQAEADRRISEGEKKNRAIYDEAYSAEVSALEEELAKSVKAIRDNYRDQLKMYRDSLGAQEPDTASFTGLAKKILGLEG